MGSTIAQLLAMEELDDLMLIDIVQGLPQGESLDIGHLAAQHGSDVEITGSNDYKDLAGSELVILAAGLARRPGMTRMDLLVKNTDIVKQVAGKIAEYAPSCKLLVVTNPLDVMTYVAYKTTGFHHQKVFGMGGMLDLSRFNHLLAAQLGVSRSSLHVQVIGEHGENMVPVPKYSSVFGIPLLELLGEERVRDAVEKTRKIAAEVIALKGATFYGPALGVVKMAKSVVKDKKNVFPVSSYLQGEYGVSGIYIGTPVVLGKEGVERIIELKLTEEERSIFLKGAEGIKSAIASINM